MTSLVVTYILWFFFGAFGVHHLYLGRICQAITWFCTGAGFGFGWLLDLFQIPTYIDEINHERTYIKERQRYGRPPACSTVRFVGQITLASWLGYISIIAMPFNIWHSTYFQFVAAAILAFIIAVGVYIVGNIGFEERTLLSAWSGAWPAVFILMCLFKIDGNGPVLSAIISAIKAKKPLTCRISLNGRMVYMSDAIPNMDVHYAWQYAKEKDWTLIFHDSLHSFPHFFHTRAVVPLDQLEQAYQTVGVNSWTSRQELRSRCRQLMKKTHPDTNSNSDPSAFMQIQRACELLGARPPGP